MYAHKKNIITKSLIVLAIAIPIVIGLLVMRLRKNTQDQTTLQMVYVAGGEFTMGPNNTKEDLGYDEEKPAHQVTVSSFYISKYLVTVA